MATLGFDSLLTPLVGAAVCIVLLRIAFVACERATLTRDRRRIAELSRGHDAPRT